VIPKVTIKKLGKQRALGIAYTNDNLIEIDPRHKTPYSLFDTEIHEFLHIRFPEWSETKVKQETVALKKYLWSLNYRKVNF